MRYTGWRCSRVDDHVKWYHAHCGIVIWGKGRRRSYWFYHDTIGGVRQLRHYNRLSDAIEDAERLGRKA